MMDVKLIFGKIDTREAGLDSSPAGIAGFFPK